MTSKDFFFCYSPYLAEYITKQGVNAITIAINPANMNKFTLFEQSNELNMAIADYKNRNN